MLESAKPIDMAELYEAFYSPVYNYVFYKLLHREDTEDLVSQVFLKIANNLDRYDPQKASVKTWVFRITDNALIDFYRRRKPQTSMDDEENGIADVLSVDFEEQYDSIVSPERKALYKALTKLSERERTLIYYRYFEHITNRDIAKALHMNESTVGAILARARQKLKTIMLPEVDGGFGA